MSKLPDINLLTGRQIEEVLKTCDSYLGKKLGLADASENTKLPIIISSLNLSWNTTDDFEKDINLLTKQKDIRSSYTELYTKWEQKLAQEKSEEVEKTTLSKQELELLEKEAETRKSEEDKSKSAGKLRTRSFIKSQEKLYLKIPKDIKVPEITAEEELKIKELIDTKIKNNPTSYSTSLSKTIVEQNLKPEMTKEEISLLKANAKIVSINYTDKLLGISNKDVPIAVASKLAYLENPIHVANSLIDPNNPLIGTDLAKSAQAAALVLENDNAVARNLLANVADQKLLSIFYPVGKEVASFEVSIQKDQDSVIEIDKKAFTEQGNQIADFVQQNTREALKGNIWRIADRTFSNVPWYSKFRSFIGPSLQIPLTSGAGAVQPSLSLLWQGQGIKLLATNLPSVLSSSFGEGVLLTPGFNFKFGSFGFSRTAFTTVEGLTGQALGINTGNFGITFIKGGEKGLQILVNLGVKTAAPAIGEAVVVETGIKAGLSGVISGWLATMGITLPVPVLNVIVFVAGLIITLGKPLWEWLKNFIKKHQDTLMVIGALLMGGGVLLRSIPMFFYGGLIFIPTVLKTGFSLAKAASRTFRVFSRIGKMMAITIATPIIVVLVVFPILVAIILFIINSGAYIVPPQTSSGTIPAGCSAIGSEVSSRARAINNNLQLGFNGYYNKSPDYPELWNAALFAQNPNPDVQTNSIGADDMFWCNYMATKSFLAVNQNIPFSLSAMATYFQSQSGKWISGDTATPSEVCPGDAVFFKIPADSAGLAHVGIVYSVSSDGITTVESNAPYKTMFYPVDGSGHFQIIGSGSSTIRIVGFGVP